MEAMERVTLDRAFVTNGMRHVSFWNGRVLTAEDLRDEQRANQLGRGRLGRAIGPGVVTGLAVSAAGTAAVHVTHGLAVDGLGQAVELPVDVEVSLVVPPESSSGDGLFTVCDPVTSHSPTGTGLYLLVVRRASEQQSSVAGVSAYGNGVATECGPKYVVDGVSFRLVGLDVAGLAGEVGVDAADELVLGTLGSALESDLARNVVAHLFLDTAAWASFLADPFGANPRRTELGALSVVRDDSLLSCEVPIALVSWASGGVGFVDSWAVRRPCATRPAVSAIDSIGESQRARLGRASYGQFHEQLASIRDELGSADRSRFRLEDRFRYLPAAGLIPVDRAGRRGFDPANVFGAMVVRGPAGLPANRVGAIIDGSLHHPPIDVTSGEVVYVYSIDKTGSGVPDHLVFCTSHMDFLADELVIDAVFPGGVLRLGQRIEIRGRGFVPPDEIRVFFDALRVDPLPGSTDTRLVVDVPMNLQVDSDGTEVGLLVSNGVDEDRVPVVVGHPVQPVLGDLHVRWLAVEPATIEIGEEVSISYAVRSGLNQRADVALALGGTLEVIARAELLDAAGDPITGPVALDVDGEITVVVRIDPVPDLASFELELAAGAADVTGSLTRIFETGTPTTPPDPAITLLVNDIDPQGNGQAELVGSTIRLGVGTLADIEIFVRVTEPGDYEVSVQPTDTGGPWQSVLSEPQDGVFENITSNEIDTDGFAERLATVTVGRNGAPPPASATVTFVVRRPHRSDDARIDFTVEPM